MTPVDTDEALAPEEVSAMLLAAAERGPNVYATLRGWPAPRVAGTSTRGDRSAQIDGPPVAWSMGTPAIDLVIAAAQQRLIEGGGDV